MSDLFKLAYDLGAKIIYNLVKWVMAFCTGFVELFVTGWRDYLTIFNMYFEHFTLPVKILAILLALILIAIPVLIIILIVKRIILRARLRAAGEDNIELYKEIGLLNRQVTDLMDEKAKILNMRASAVTGGLAGGVPTSEVTDVYGDPNPGFGGRVVTTEAAGGIADPLADPLAAPAAAVGGAVAADGAAAVGGVSGMGGAASVGATVTDGGSVPPARAQSMGLDQNSALGAVTTAAINAITASQRNDDNDTSVERFLKLSFVDAKYIDYERPAFDDGVTLKQFADNFRLFAASQLKLYYTPEIVRRFVAGLAASKLLILEGISGTGKTSLPYAFSRYMNNPATIISVQPSYRDRTELIGYFNEFTKKFNETEFLRSIYEAGYREEPSLVVLDEMNLARIEYYFAEMLSVLELPNRDEWQLDLVPTAWPNDPLKLENGKIRVSPTLWFVGTANNDDSTYTITDKVYDRAIPIELNERAAAFECDLQPGCYVTTRHLEQIFAEAKEMYPVSEDVLEKMAKLDNYLQTRFKLAFGNRIMKQLHDFLPVYVACGGTELGGMDYIICRKVFKKFESLNVTFVRDEIKNLIVYMENTFGKTSMAESRAYLTRIQNLY